ncbi:MAG: hypothetical protein JSU63_01045 [Phycisphaerales bacterium]|nr:MAG: hypothetical protein JSU63_01045 [Phycisphaerales bacterium]
MSTVIKVGESGPILKRLSTVDLADHLAEAQAVIAAAKRQASGIVSKAREDTRVTAEKAKKDAYEDGYRRGFVDGQQAGHEAARKESIERFTQQHAGIVASMERAVAEIDAMKEDLRLAAERDVLDFAVSIAGKLTFAIGREHRESATANLRRALELVASQTALTVRVHPDDIASTEMFADSVLRQADASRAVSIVADESIGPGGCQVQSGAMQIDASLETQVSEMVSLLAGSKSEDG